MNTERMQPLAVVVRLLNQNEEVVHRSTHRFRNANDIPRFEELVQYVYPGCETYVINVREASQPGEHSKKTSKNQLWCPYCRAYRHFPLFTFLGTYKCEICGVSTRDWHVYTINKINSDGVIHTSPDELDDEATRKRQARREKRRALKNKKGRSKG